MGELVWLDGRLIPIEEARISPLDRGFLYGDGLFETMRSYDGTVHLLRRHLERLHGAAERIGLRVPDSGELRDAIHVLLRENGATDTRIRLTVSRGNDRDAEPTVFIRQQPLADSRNRTADVGLLRSDPKPEDVDVLAFRRIVPEIYPRVKSLNYLPEILAQDDLRRRGLREGFLLTPEGYVAEGTVSNLFCVMRGELLTPPVELGILPGVTRMRVMELATGEGLTVLQRPFTLGELHDAAECECFYTNSVRELVPVGKVGGRTIGTGETGPVTLLLRELYRAELADEDL